MASRRPDLRTAWGRTPTLAVVLAASPLLAQSLPPVAPVPGPDQPIVIARGPFAPSYDSLARYRYPEWFRDAKLGFWAHWGPQSVPMLATGMRGTCTGRGTSSTRTISSGTAIPRRAAGKT